MSRSVYSKDSFKVDGEKLSNETKLRFVKFYSDLFKYINVKSGEIIECLVGTDDGEMEDILMDLVLTDGSNSDYYIGKLESLINSDYFKFECTYSLDVHIQFEESINYFSELLEAKEEKGIEFRNLTYTDEDDDVLLFHFKDGMDVTPTTEEGLLNVSDIKLWNDNNYFLNLELSKADYLSSKPELDMLMKQIAELNQNTYEVADDDEIVELLIRGASEFNINNMDEYVGLLKKLNVHAIKAKSTLSLVNNMFSYEFAVLSVEIVGEKVSIWSNRI